MVRGYNAKTNLGDIKEIFLPENRSAGEGQECDASRLVGYLGRPIGDHVLPCPFWLSLGGGAVFLAVLRRVHVSVTVWTPLKIYHALDLETFLSLQVHARKLVDANHLPCSHPCHKLIVRAPLQRWPLHLLSGAAAVKHAEVCWEGTEEVPRFDVPNSKVVTLVVWGEVLRALKSTLWYRDGLV